MQLEFWRNKFIYCDASPRHRSPLGAQPAGTRVHLFLGCPEAVSALSLLPVYGDAPGAAIPLTRCPGGFQLDWDTPPQPQVIFFRFQAETPDGTLFLGLGAQGVFWADITDTPTGLEAFQLTLYAPDFTAPDWFSGGVLYQIFPDRFALGNPETVAAGLAYHRAMGREMELHADWEEPVKWRGENGADYYPNDFYGGTLDAIRQKLPYLHDLGVTALYLNPIFESDSNHRYNTADYRRVDPILGSEADLRRLCREAAALDIRILLDGVFSHTGADSRYFNQKGCYPAPGAWQSQSSPYFSWYDFQDWPTVYKSWWGFASLPEVRETDPSWLEEIVTGENSVVKSWLRAGVSGYRLDVADELPDETLAALRRAVREEKPDALLLGEVWEDPTTKCSYAHRRRYALGESLDSVMNYPLRRGVLDFLLGKSDSRVLLRLLLRQRLHYPPPLYRSLMHLLSSHDVDRALTVLSTRMEGQNMSWEQRASFFVSPEQTQRGRAAMQLATALLWALPGMPCIYYGEEAGMQGFGDPFVRQSMDWHAAFLQEHYARLGQLRRTFSALRRGDAAFAAPEENSLFVLRYDPADNAAVLAVIARADSCGVLDLAEFVGGTLPPGKNFLAQPLFHPEEDRLVITDGLLRFSLPAGTFAYYQLQAL